MTARSSSCPRNRSTASVRGRWAPTPSDPPPVIAKLKAELAALDAEPLVGASGIERCRRRTEIVDTAVRSMFEPFEGVGIGLAALGGYGRREMTPGSDVDLLFLHDDLGDDELRPAVDAVLYPLWDAGMPVSHAVRTVEECRAEAEARVENLTTVLDARVVAGSEGLAEAARAAVTQVAAGDVEGFVHRLEAWREERGRRFGHAGHMLEPDLKESIGGLRDVPVLRWCAVARGIDDDSVAELVPSRDRLLLVRAALHQVSGTRSTRFQAEHHQAVADVLGFTAEPDWESRDVLMRELFIRSRWVDFTVTVALRHGKLGILAMSRIYGRVLGASSPTDLPSLLRNDWPYFLEWLLSPELIPDPVGVLPEWPRIRGRPQRDPYHLYPVDVHLTKTVQEAERLVRDPHEPFATQAAALIDDPTPLLLGALLHDIGKVGRGSHVAEGISIAARILERMELVPEVRDDVLFLVRHHLLLSDTAIRRNLEDEDLILHVAAKVGDARRLALLYLLTVSDAIATGPSASTPWRMNLVRDLVSKVSHVFERGLMDRDRAARLEEAGRAVQDALAGSGMPVEVIDAFLQGAPAGYLLWVEPAKVIDHARLVIPTPRPFQVRIHVAPGRWSGTYEVAIGAVDRLGLLAAVAGSFTVSGLSILSAQAFTTSDGVALDVFDVRGAFEEDVDADRWTRFQSALEAALEGRGDLEVAVRSLRSHYRSPRSDVPVGISVDQEASDFFTLIEVGGPDRLGLLFDLARTFSQHGLDVHVAKVATYGPRVVDVFYVRDQEGQKPEDPDRIADLARALREAASSN